MEREIILVSACLLGAKVRYDGKTKKEPLAQELLNYYDIIPICPEMDGGLDCPRPAGELKDGKVFDQKGKDLSAYYRRGASLAQEIARSKHIKMAVLKDNSPSCGSTQVHDGSFSGRLIMGSGLTAAALKEIGVKIYTENNLADLLSVLRRS